MSAIAEFESTVATGNSGPPAQVWSSGVRQALIAGALHIAGYVALAYGQEPLSHWFYLWVWWTFIVAVDGVVLAKRGSSLLRTRTREAVILSFASSVIWFHFETWNLRIENWYYINADASALWRAFRYVVAFATVIPGVFEIYDLLKVYGIPKRVSVRPLTITPRVWLLSYALGVTMGVLPLIWPMYCFPLVWGTFVFILDPLNAKWGGHSFWMDWSRGDITVLCRLLLAGLIAGGCWESWNFWAPVKWVYTVPFFENVKLFEMPVFGFLGFPPFAVELMCMVTFITLLRRAHGWQPQPEGPTTGPVLAPATWRVIILASILFVIVQIRLTDLYIIGSLKQTIAQSVWADTDAGRALIEAGYGYPADVARALNFPSDRTHIAEALDWPGEDLETVTGPILLSALPEVGADDAYILKAMGIYTVPMLAQADAEKIATGFPRQRIPSGDKRGSPPVRRARIWIKAAKKEVASWPGWRQRALAGAESSDMMPAANGS